MLLAPLRPMQRSSKPLHRQLSLEIHFNVPCAQHQVKESFGQ
jgi:hypothetical protein